MSRRCAICTHEQRVAIEEDIIRGRSRPQIGQQYGMSSTAVYRHENTHMVKTLAASKKALEVATGDVLVGKLTQLQERTEIILDKCERDKNYRAALYAIQQLKGLIELCAKLAGELKTGSRVSITVNSEWISLKTLIFETLREYPDAELALKEKLRERTE